MRFMWQCKCVPSPFLSVQRYDQQITGPYYKQLLHDCINNTFMHEEHGAYHENCPLWLLFMYELCSLYFMESWFIKDMLDVLLPYSV